MFYSEITKVKKGKKYKLYFSAFEKKTAIGRMEGNSIITLHATSAEGNFISFCKFPNIYLRNKKQSLKELFQ
mgnify:CR=1 FL=1